MRSRLVRWMVLAVLLLRALDAAGAAVEEPALPLEVMREAPQLHRLGQGQLKFLFWKVYDIALYTSGARWERSDPYALAVVYARHFTGTEIADEGVKQMRHLGYHDAAELDQWRTDMLQGFPGVSAGDRVEAVFLPPGEVQVYIDDKMTADIRDPAFASAFFGMWLDPKTSEPGLRQALLGRSQ